MSETTEDLERIGYEVRRNVSGLSLYAPSPYETGEKFCVAEAGEHDAGWLWHQAADHLARIRAKFGSALAPQEQPGPAERERLEEFKKAAEQIIHDEEVLSWPTARYLVDRLIHLPEFAALRAREPAPLDRERPVNLFGVLLAVREVIERGNYTGDPKVFDLAIREAEELCRSAGIVPRLRRALAGEAAPEREARDD